MKHVLLLILVVMIASVTVRAQTDPPKKYPSLLWEITGKGARKPSYLFGTMHVSSKMAFHLGDAFFTGLRSVDVVALELDPAQWQKNMVRMDGIKKEYGRYFSTKDASFMNSRTFAFEPYQRAIAYILRSEPYVINGLLYRTREESEDFEEDTYLDLYIYQTGRRLGKICTGLENYFGTERLIMEGYYDEYYDKEKKSSLSSMGESQEEIVEAYSKGDLDRLDSLDKKSVTSPAFTEKFLYARNSIQAGSIDSIIHGGRTVFAGVGAAHLPGERGVIELLRARGYTLRPVKMNDRDARQKDAIDRIRVPVQYRPFESEDGLYTAMLPENPYALSDDRSPIDRRQVADMTNGVYFMVTRFPTDACMTGQDVPTVRRKIDSLLYENIPGKILVRRSIERNGLSGIEVVNRTRRGDVHRSQIYISPFEVVVFSMNGTGEYLLKGPEADRFFQSIAFRPVRHAPTQGVQEHDKGFSFWMPGEPSRYVNRLGMQATDDRLEYRYADTAGGTYYLFQKSEFYNADYFEPDTFQLSLVHASILESPDVVRTVRQTLGTYRGYPRIDIEYKLTDSSMLHMRTVMKGSGYYTMLVRSASATFSPEKFFGSLEFTGLSEPTGQRYTDAYGDFSVTTPFQPELDSSFTPIINKLENIRSQSSDEDRSDESGPIPARYSERYAGNLIHLRFENPVTREWIGVYYRKYGRYRYFKDSVDLWKWMDEERKNVVVTGKRSSRTGGDWIVREQVVRDTIGSSYYRVKALFKGNRFYSIITLGDTLTRTSKWVEDFFNTFDPVETPDNQSVLDDKFPLFSADFNSPDTVVARIARRKVSDPVIFPAHLPEYLAMIAGLSITERDYFSLKQEMIASLGHIRDTANPGRIVAAIRGVHARAADTAAFQNAALQALATQSTKESLAALKELFVQDPPDLQDEGAFSEGIFQSFDDSLKLASLLYPDLLQLTGIDEYKPHVLQLLVSLADSGFVEPKDYEGYFSKIMFDARFALKKLQTANERETARELHDSSNRRSNQNDDEKTSSYRRYSSSAYSRSSRYSSSRDHSSNELDNYGILLVPFYEKYPSVPKFFEKLLGSKDVETRINAATLLLRYKRSVPDSLWSNIALSPKYRGMLYEKLNNIKRLDVFPPACRDQQEIARSLVIGQASGEWKQGDSIAFVRRSLMRLDEHGGYVYFFKLRRRKEDKWSLGYAGLFPERPSDIASDSLVVNLMREDLDDGQIKQVDKYIDQEMRRMIILSHPNGRYFYYGSDD